MIKTQNLEGTGADLGGGAGGASLNGFCWGPRGSARSCEEATALEVSVWQMYRLPDDDREG